MSTINARLLQKHYDIIERSMTKIKQILSVVSNPKAGKRQAAKKQRPPAKIVLSVLSDDDEYQEPSSDSSASSEDEYDDQVDDADEQNQDDDQDVDQDVDQDEDQDTVKKRSRSSRPSSPSTRPKRNRRPPVRLTASLASMSKTNEQGRVIGNRALTLKRPCLANPPWSTGILNPKAGAP